MALEALAPVSLVTAASFLRSLWCLLHVGMQPKGPPQRPTLQGAGHGL